MRWLLEQHSTLYPYNSNKAQSIRTEIEEYGQSIFEQLKILPFLPRQSSGSSPILFDVYDSDDDSIFHQIHWEALEAINERYDYLPPLTVRRRNRGPRARSPPPAQHGSAKSTFNILMVISRPAGKEDIDPSLGSRSIMNIIMSLPEHDRCRISFEIARPGTWAAFESCIRERTQSWWTRGGQGPWFDAVHFDTHGTIENGVAYLLFLSSSGEKTLAQSAEVVARMLARYEIPFVFLNACDSAVVSENKASNLAKILIGAGIPEVLAMSFKVTSSAAKIFIQNFYNFYLRSRRRNITDAVFFSRSLMRRDQRRDGLFGVQVQLPDFLVPVHYLAQKDTSCEFHERPEELSFEILTVPPLLEGAQESSPLITGREQDILEIEWHLLRRSDANILLLYGVPGVGKSVLMRYLCSWWVQTRLVESARYFDLGGRANQCWDFLEELNKGSTALTDTASSILVFDGLHHIAHPFGHGEESMKKMRRSKLRKAVSLLKGTSTKVVLVSRCKETWLPLGQRQRFKLHGLSHFSSLAYASKVLSDMGWHDQFIDKKDAQYIAYLVHRLDYNPLCIRIFLQSMKLQSEILPKLVADEGEDAFRWERSCLWEVNTPEELCNTILSGVIFGNPADSYWQECKMFCWSLMTKWTGYVPFRDDMIQFIPLGLTYFNNVFCEDWYAQLLPNLQLLGPLAMETVHWYMDTYLLDSGWAEVLDDSTIVSYSNPRGFRYIKVHPLLTQGLRWLLLEPGKERFQKIFFSDFLTYHFSRLGTIVNLPLTPYKQRMMEMESANFLAAYEGYKQGFRLQRNVKVPAHFFNYGLAASCTLVELLDTFIRGTSAVIPLEVILVRARIYLNDVMQVRDWQNTHFVEFGLVCENLAYNLKDREPTEAQKYVSLILSAFLKANKHKRTEFFRNTESGSYRTLSNKVTMSYVAKALVVQGIISTSNNDLSVAEEAFKLTGVITTGCIGGPMDKDFTKKLEILYQALKGLSLVASSKEQQEQYKKDRLEILKQQTHFLRSRYTTFRQSNVLGGRVVPPVEDLGMNFEVSDGYTELIDILDVEWDSPRPGPNMAVGLDPLKLLRSYTNLQDNDPGPYLDVLQKGLKVAMQTGQKASEYLYRWKLIELAIVGWEWDVAAQHIHLIQELERDHPHGPWPSSTLRKRNLAHVQWGIMFLWLGDIEQALQHFPSRREVLQPSDYTNPSDWASAAQFKVNYNLLILNASWMSWMPPDEVKDLMLKARNLITSFAQRTWPDDNYIPEPLDVDHPIGGLLDWHYYDSVEETRPFLEDKPGKALQTLARIFYRIYLQPTSRRQILIRKYASPSAWPFANRKARKINPFWPTQIQDVRTVHWTGREVVLGSIVKDVYRCQYWKTRTLVKKVIFVDINGMYGWSVERRMSRSVNVSVISVEQEGFHKFVAGIFEASSREAAEREVLKQERAGKVEKEGDETGYRSIGLTLRGRWAGG